MPTRIVTLLLLGATLTFPAQAQKLLNIDFGAHTNPSFTNKTGKAAYGLSEEDSWNLYSRDGANGEFLNQGQLADLKYSDNSPSGATLWITNAPGAWPTQNPDPMFQSYLYSGEPAIQMSIQDLPAGLYDLYVYAHGSPPYENALVEVASGDLAYGTKATSTAPDWDGEGWTEGNEYVVFRGIPVKSGQPLFINSKRGAAGISVINGLQIAASDGPEAEPMKFPSASDLFDIANGTTVTASSPVWATIQVEAMFGGQQSSIEQGSVVFADEPPADGAHFVEFKTATPVMLETIRLFASGDGPEALNEREFARFTLKAKSAGSDGYDVVLASFEPVHPYNFLDRETALVLDTAVATRLSAQEFRAEFIHWVSGRGFDGPRIIELDGFGAPGLPPVITNQPASLTVADGASAQFTVGATGVEPMTFQWFFNGGTLANETNSTLALANVEMAHAGTYSVRVANQDGSATSAGAVLNVTNSTPGGLVNFNNRVEGRVDAPIRDEEGRLLSGTEYLAQLFERNSAGAFTPIGAAVPFGTGDQAGYFLGGVRSVPGAAPGGVGVLQVRVWATAAGTSYNQAVENGGARWASVLLAVIYGGDGLPPAELAGLGGPSELMTFPRITRQPVGRTVIFGQRAELSVVATGGGLKYQWFHDGTPIAGAASFALVIENFEPANAGVYKVEVSNLAGLLSSEPATLAGREPDVEAPVVTILEPVPGFTTAESATLRGQVTDNVGVVQMQWERNGTAGPFVSVSEDGRFFAPDIPLVRGNNLFVVRARDADGNIGVAEILVSQQSSRAVLIPGLDPVQEGGLISVPIHLRSEGDISAITVQLMYPPAYLADPHFAWGIESADALAQVNTNIAGQVRASFALPGTTLPAGSNLLATVTFRARSVASTVTAPLGLQLVGVFRADGSPITSRTDALGATLRVLKRKFVGDNNANDRLDVGDASIMMRMVTQLDPIRFWDVPANDLNKNQQLDAGDIIRVLRAVVELDPQPAGPAPAQEPGALAAFSSAAASANPEIVLESDQPQLSPGRKITLRVALQNRLAAISGASFRLDFPAEALQFEGADAVRLGNIVPADAVTLWNLDGADQGTLRFAISTPGTWPANSGGILEVSFVARAGAPLQPRWPVILRSIDLADDWSVASAQDAVLTLRSGDLLSLTLNENRQARISLEGQAGADYRIEKSGDLVAWSEVATVVNENGTITVLDSAPAGQRRFYRAVQAP